MSTTFLELVRSTLPNSRVEQINVFDMPNLKLSLTDRLFGDAEIAVSVSGENLDYQESLVGQIIVWSSSLGDSTNILIIQCEDTWVLRSVGAKAVPVVVR